MSVLVLLVLASSTMVAVPTCVTEDFQYPGSAGCCTFRVEYCYDLVGGIVNITFGTITLTQGDCPLSPAVFNWLRRKVVYKNRTALGLTIPNCPTTSTVVVHSSVSSCYFLQSTINGIIVWEPCGTTVCEKTCQMCISQIENDPCTEEAMIAYVSCSYTVIECTGVSPNSCRINTCDSFP